MPTLAVRNNNPGNLRDPNTGAFRQFATQEDGYAALLNDLDAKRTGNTRTGLGPNSSLSEFASKYAPAGDGNDPVRYASSLATKLGAGVNTPISQVDIGKLAVSIAQTEDRSAKSHVAGDTPDFISDEQFSLMQGNEAPDFISDADFQSMGGATQPTQPNGLTSPDEFNTYSLSGREEEKKNGGVVGFLGGVAKAIAEPVANLVARPGQLVQHTLGGDTAPIEGKFLGLDITDPYSRGFEETAKDVGRGIETVGLGVPVKGFGSAAALGATQGFGNSLEKEGSKALTTTEGLVNTAINTGVGAVAAPAVYGATKLAGNLLKGTGETISGKAAIDAQEGIKNAYASALNLNASERALEKRTGKELADVLLKYKAPLGRYANGTLDSSEAVGILRDVLDPFNAQASEILNNPQGVVRYISFDDILSQVTKKIQESTLPQAQKNSMIREAEKLVQAEASQYGNQIAPAISDKVKQGFWNTTFQRSVTTKDALYKNVNYLIGNALKEAEENAIAGTDAAVDLGTLNQERSVLVDAIKRLSKLDGVKLLKGGRLGNLAGGMVGTVTGLASGLGPLGALAGDYFGTKAAQFVSNPATKIGAAQARASILNSIPVNKAVGSGIGLVGNLLKKAAPVAARGAQPAVSGLVGR